jgi:hypothetical protein
LYGPPGNGFRHSGVRNHRRNTADPVLEQLGKRPAAAGRAALCSARQALRSRTSFAYVPGCHPRGGQPADRALPRIHPATGLLSVLVSGLCCPMDYLLVLTVDAVEAVDARRARALMKVRSPSRCAGCALPLATGKSEFKEPGDWQI